jgi:hypothetical protein
MPKRRHTNERPRGSLILRGLLFTTAATTTVLGVAPVASASTKGSFTFSGEISGKLKETTCQGSPSGLAATVIQWDGVKLKIGGKTQTVRRLSLDIIVAEFGYTYSMKTPVASISIDTGGNYKWTSDAGTITTNSSGTSGSVDGTLKAGKGHPGSVTIKGFWSGCPVPV